MVVRRSGRYTSEEVHQALFEETPEPKTLEELKAWTETAYLLRSPKNAKRLLEAIAALEPPALSWTRSRP